MSSTPSGSPSRSGCAVCSGGEYAKYVSEKRTPEAAYVYGSGSVGRALGRRSLETTFRSFKGSLTSRHAPDMTTDQTPATPAASASASASASAENSPVEPPAKQRWYDSFRSRASQIHMPASPTSMSSTVKRTRFFRSSPTQACDHDAPPSKATQKLPTRPPLALPRLDISSFQAEMQRMYTPSGECSDHLKSSRDPKSEDSSPTTAPLKMNRTTDDDSGLPTLVAAAEVKRNSPGSAGMAPIKTKPAMYSTVVEMKPKSKVTFVNVEPKEALEEDWRTKCTLYYKGSPWQPEHSEDFSDAASALSHFALRNMLNGRRRCSNVLLWTGQVLDTNARIKQTFTAYPHCDGPRRVEIEDKYCIEWAFIAFTDELKSTKLPPMKSKDMSEEDERLMMALKKIVQMGYHVNVWTSRDNENWNFDMDCIRDFGMKKLVAQRHTEPENIERQERYKAFIQHRVSGFSQADIDILQKSSEEEGNDQRDDRDDEDDDDYDYAHDGYEHQADDALRHQDQSQSRAQVESASDLSGHLEHRDETVAKSEDEDDEEEASQGTEISVHTEDLDMADRLGV